MVSIGVYGLLDTSLFISYLACANSDITFLVFLQILQKVLNGYSSIIIIGIVSLRNNTDPSSIVYQHVTEIIIT